MVAIYLSIMCWTCLVHIITPYTYSYKHGSHCYRWVTCVQHIKNVTIVISRWSKVHCEFKYVFPHRCNLCYNISTFRRHHKRRQWVIITMYHYYHYYYILLFWYWRQSYRCTQVYSNGAYIGLATAISKQCSIITHHAISKFIWGLTQSMQAKKIMYL